MVELHIVRFINGPRSPDSAEYQRFVAVKARTLSYVTSKLLRKEEPGEAHAVPADIGAVRTASDGRLLLESLKAEFPEQDLG